MAEVWAFVSAPEVDEALPVRSFANVAPSRPCMWTFALQGTVLAPSAIEYGVLKYRVDFAPIKLKSSQVWATFRKRFGSQMS